MIENFKYYCQKVLPLVYDNSLSYYELLCKVISKLNEVIDGTNNVTENINKMIGDTIKEMIESGKFQDVTIDALLKNSIRVYNNVAEMLADTYTEENVVTLCKGYYEPNDGGYSFFITSKNVNKKPHITSNTGMNYYYVVNETVSVKQFGAKGDKLSDDSDAFQLALDSGYNVLVPLMYGQHYMIRKPLVLKHDRCTVYGDLPTHTFTDYRTNDEYSDYSHGYIVCDFNNTSDVLFTCEGQFQTFANLAIVRNASILVPSGSVGNVAIKYYKTEANGTNISNCDGEIRNCLFRDFNHAVELWGRGLWYTDCYNIHNNIDFYVKFRTSYWWRDEESSTSMLQTYPEFYGRGIRFCNNRIHTSLEYTVKVESEAVADVDDWNGNVLNGAIISDNQIDLGRGGFLFNAPLYGCLITNNVFYRLSTNCLAFTNKVKSTIIEHNVIRGLVSSVRPSLNFVPLYGVYISGDFIGSRLCNNVFDKVQLCGIIMDNTNTEDSVISGNTFTEYARESASQGAIYNYAGIVLGLNANRVNVCNNTFAPVSYRGNFAIRPKSPTKGVWTNVVILGNCAYSQGLTPYVVSSGEGSARNTVQDY